MKKSSTLLKIICVMVTLLVTVELYINSSENSEKSSLILNSIFIDNFADDNMGEIYVSPDDLHGIKRLYIRNCIFKSNKADDNS